MKRGLIAIIFLGLVAGLKAQIVPADYSKLQTMIGSTTKVPAITGATVLNPGTVSSFTVTNVSINGVTYSSANRYTPATASGGGTAWINVTYTVPSGVNQSFYLSFLVANKSDNSYNTGLAIDKITTAVTGTLFSEGFSSATFASQSSGAWTLQGSGGTFSGITNLSATEGTHLAFIDTQSTGTSVDVSSIGGTNATILKSPSFNLVAGQTLSVDLAFFSNDGVTFTDFALVRLFDSAVSDQINGNAYATLFTAIAPGAIPEPAETVLLMALGALGLARYRSRRLRA